METYTCPTCGTEHWTEDAALKCAENDELAWKEYYAKLRTDAQMRELHHSYDKQRTENTYVQYGPGYRTFTQKSVDTDNK
jgi:hypothetical protein